MYAQHPEIAKRWTAEYGSKIKRKRKKKLRRKGYGSS
jgi:hypothetical protein